MIIWTIKLLGTVREAINGRRYPHQMAWAVAFGLLLGIVPHGNLLAVAILIGVLSLRINHAMAGLAAIGATFAATHIDPLSHQLGDLALSHPSVADMSAAVWQLPLVAWTDLNNTVVLGSFLIGLAALVPVFLVTYPVFRLLAPATDMDPDPSESPSDRVHDVDPATHEITVVDQGHRQAAKPHPTTRPGGQPCKAEPSTEIGETGDIGVTAADVVVDTRIDVIRMKDYRDCNVELSPTSSNAPNPMAVSPSSDLPSSEMDEQQPMDEALSYLLRQLRDSQQRKVA